MLASAWFSEFSWPGQLLQYVHLSNAEYPIFIPTETKKIEMMFYMGFYMCNTSNVIIYTVKLLDFRDNEFNEI